MHPAIKYAEQICYSSKEVLHFTYEMAKKYADSPGVYVECGVAAGAQIIAMAAGAPNKTIYAFDSFEGIPLPSNKDDQMPGIKMLSKEEQSKLPNPGEQILESSGATSVSVEGFLNHIRNAFEVYTTGGIQYGDGNDGYVFINEIRAVEGWFERTLPNWGRWIEPISILRLDGDLYNSTYVCLKYLYPKLITGGVCIIDDAALPGCWNAVIDYFDIEDMPKMDFIMGNDYKVAYWTK